MNAFEVAVIEDDANDLKTLTACLSRYENEHGCRFNIAQYSYGEAFLQEFNRKFDIVFMDVQLLGMDGMETSRRFRENNPLTVLILVTNTEHYAIRGYAVNANDFILKPVRYVSFESKITKALSSSISNASVQKITVKLKEETKYIPLKNIFYIEISQHELIYHTTSGNYNAYGSLNKIEESIQQYGFSRCCSWYLVNLNQIKGLFKDDIQLYNGETLHISRGKRKTFLEDLTRYCGGGGYN